MSLHNRIFNQTALQNTDEFLMYYNMLKNICTSSFVYKNLPDTCDRRTLENALYNQGKAVFVYDENMGKLLSLNVMYSNGFDIYGNPLNPIGYSKYTNYKIRAESNNSVMIYNNDTRDSSFSLCMYYARKLSEIDTISFVNVRSQKTPLLILTDEKQRLTMENVYMQYDGNYPVIFGKKKTLNPDDFQVLKTDSPYIADKLFQLKLNYINEFLNLRGIPNIDYPKKERLLSEEVKANLGFNNIALQSYLQPRKDAIKKVNEKFGTNIKVLFNEEVLEKCPDIQPKLDTFAKPMLE